MPRVGKEERFAVAVGAELRDRFLRLGVADPGGLENYGPESECTYTPLLDQSYGGNGPFTITAVDSAGDVVFETECAEGELCTDEGAGSIPAGSTVTIDVTGEPGSVGAGDFE